MKKYDKKQGIVLLTGSITTGHFPTLGKSEPTH